MKLSGFRYLADQGVENICENGETTIRRVDVVFPVLMGKKSIDGTIQGLLDLSGIPYVGSGVLASASCMDKSHTHMVMDDYNINTAEWRLITQREINDLDGRCRSIASEMGFPLIVKPANSGSNAGTSLAENPEELVASVKLAFSSDNKVVVEKYIKARKLEAAVLGCDMPVCSPVGEITTPQVIFDPLNFNVSTGDDLKIPADISKDTEKKVQETAIAAFKARQSPHSLLRGQLL